MAPRPKFDDYAKELYLQALQDGSLGHEAAKRVGVTYRTVQRHRDNDPKFAQEEVMARQWSTEQVESVLFKCALAGEPWAVKMWMQAHDKETYNPSQKIEVEQKVTHELEVGERLSKLQGMKERLAEVVSVREIVALERADD